MVGTKMIGTKMADEDKNDFLQKFCDCSITYVENYICMSTESHGEQ